MEDLVDSLERISTPSRLLEQTHDPRELLPRRHNVSRLRRYQKYAIKLHRELNMAWKCPCQTSHWAMLGLEQQRILPSASGALSSRLDPWDSKVCFTLLLSSGENSDASDLFREIFFEYMETDDSRPESATKGMKTPRFTIIVPDHPTISMSKPNYRGSEVEKVEDLCKTISALPASKTAKLWVDSRENLHLLPESSNSSVSTIYSTTISLADLLRLQSKGKTTMTLRERLGLATTLSWAVLQFHSTPWLKDEWTKDDIVFPQQPFGTSSPYVSRPFIKHVFGLHRNQSQTSQTLVATSSSSRRGHISFLTLGIVLLELYTATAFDQRRSTDNVSHKNDSTPDTELAAALPVIGDLLSWLDEERDRLTYAYAEAIRQCVRSYYNSTMPLPDLDEDAILQNMLNSVFQPILNDYSQFLGNSQEDIPF
jgi:hypothetical protein